jgi:hypothetical protein
MRLVKVGKNPFRMHVRSFLVGNGENQHHDYTVHVTVWTTLDTVDLLKSVVSPINCKITTSGVKP